MNKVILIGRLTKDPEIQDLSGDNKICKFGLAVNKRFKKDAEQTADFFNIVAWNKQAELCNKYLNKGSQIGIAGRIEIDKWQDKEGNNRYTTNIIIEEVEFLGGGQSDNESTKQDTPKNAAPRKTSKQEVEDLPF